jgi:hypothetical protein
VSSVIDLTRIAEDGRHTRSCFRLDLNAGAQEPREKAPNGHDRVVHAEHTRLEQLFAAENEELLGHRAGALGGLADFLDVGARLRVGAKLTHRELGIAGNRRQRVVQIVRDAAREPADRFHLL